MFWGTWGALWRSHGGFLGEAAGATLAKVGSFSTAIFTCESGPGQQRKQQGPHQKLDRDIYWSGGCSTLPSLNKGNVRTTGRAPYKLCEGIHLAQPLLLGHCIYVSLAALRLRQSNEC